MEQPLEVLERSGL